jgi:UPF0716 protein FxsA
MKALLLLVPLVELYVIIQVGSAIGALATIALLILSTMFGWWLTKREGLEALRQIDASVRDGNEPDKALVNGFLIMAAGVLILIPGFVTDALGFLLLLPPVRHLVGKLAYSRMQKRMGQGWMSGAASFGSGGRVWVDSTVIDVQRPGDGTDTIDTTGSIRPDAPSSDGPAELPPGRY